MNDEAEAKTILPHQFVRPKVPVDGGIYCKYCKLGGLHWVLTKEMGWRLYDVNDNRHQCKTTSIHDIKPTGPPIEIDNDWLKKRPIKL